jgi:hypothetical protein
MNQESTTQAPKKTRIYGLAVAGVLGLIIALQVLAPVLDNPTIVQDDFRQTNFWFWQFWDTSLFQDDFFAEGMQEGFKMTPLYIFIWKNIMPAFFSDLIYASKFYALIISLLGSLAAFLLIERLTNYKNIFLSLSFVATMTVVFWCTDHVSAAHVRSSVWLMLLVYLWLKSSGKDIASGLICLPMLFFNPTAFLLCMGAEGYSWLAKAKEKLLTNTFYIGTLNTIVTFLFHFVYLGGVNYSGGGKTLSLEQMKAMPEFNPGGRSAIFGSSLWDGSWWTNEHWGFGYGYLEISKVVFIALITLLVFVIFIRPSWKIVKSYLVSPLAFLAYASVSLYVLSQFVYPLLYFPSRYISVSFILLSVIISYLCLMEIFYKIFDENKKTEELSRAQKRSLKKQSLANGNNKNYSARQLYLSFIFILVAVSLWWHFSKFYFARFVSMNPEVANLVSRLPKETLIAGHPLLPDINTTSIVTKRKVYIDFERSLLFTDKGIEEIRRRTHVALDLTYAKSQEKFLELAKREGITHFMALYDFYSPQYLNNPIYIEPFNNHLRDIVQLAPGESFFLENYLKSRATRYVILDLNKLMLE